MAKKGVFVGFRLHPDNEVEREAIKIYDRLLKEKGTPRAIFTEALIRMDGKKLELYDSTKIVTKSYLEDLLADFATHLLSEMRGLAIVASAGNVDMHTETPLTEDEDTEYAKNIAAGYLARRKR